MKNPIRVKMLVKGGAAHWLRQIPGGTPLYRGCEFVFDFEATDYDWLVVYDDLPATSANERRSVRVEPLHCPQKNTLLVTSEPANIKSYGRAFTRQFGWVLTSQPEWALPHPGRIFSQPALYWFYGSNHKIPYNQMVENPPLDKTGIISTVCSNKQQKHTVHNRRYTFTHALKKQLPELEIFGRGIRPVEDKSEALDAYKYHIAIENFIGKHHWTEKLADAFLGCTLPFYYGCPNATDYFPPESFIPIDIDRVDEAAKTIQAAIANNEYEKRLPHILEARRRVMEEYNLFSVLANIVADKQTIPSGKETRPAVLKSRKVLRRNPIVALEDFYGKTKARIVSSAKH